jgi:predicted DsbA family dithiol-disulfide isomerase
MSPERLEALKQRMDRIGRSVGIIFKPGGKIGSTRGAHHLIHFCQTTQVENSVEVRDAIVTRLFEAYHELEQDISSRTVLREIAVEAGMDAAQVDECLDSFSSPEISQESEVDKEARENKEATNTGVPLFIIQKVHRVDGAQDLMEFVEIFGKIREEEGQAEA